MACVGVLPCADVRRVAGDGSGAPVASQASTAAGRSGVARTATVLVPCDGRAATPLFRCRFSPTTPSFAVSTRPSGAKAWCLGSRAAKRPLSPSRTASRPVAGRAPCLHRRWRVWPARAVVADGLRTSWRHPCWHAPCEQCRGQRTLIRRTIPFAPCPQSRKLVSTRRHPSHAASGLGIAGPKAAPASVATRRERLGLTYSR
jgi:hypothetical protein